MQIDLSHERLDIYKVYLDVASLCSDMISDAAMPIIAFDHLDRAMESIGINFMRANGLPFGSPQRAACLDISIASTHECAASLDVCIAKRSVEERAYTEAKGKLWRVRGMLLGLKRVSRNCVQEGSEPYGSGRFPFADLDLYQVALDGVRWTHDLLEELDTKARVRRKLDISTTGTVLNIAEGHGRASTADQNRFMKTALEHACQTLLLLDLTVARKETTTSRVVEGKAMQARVISMLHAWCASNETKEKRNDEARWTTTATTTDDDLPAARLHALRKHCGQVLQRCRRGKSRQSVHRSRRRSRQPSAKKIGQKRILSVLTNPQRNDHEKNDCCCLDLRDYCWRPAGRKA